jgi:hypothetical protein
MREIVPTVGKIASHMTLLERRLSKIYSMARVLAS